MDDYSHQFPIVFMLIVNVIFLICGMFIDSNAAILLFVPPAYPDS